MDFVVKLPQTKRGFNCITIIVCRLTKRQILKLITEGNKRTSTKEIAKLVYLYIYR
jgi:hypothetical protein